MSIIMVVLNHNFHTHVHERASYTKASDIFAPSQETSPSQMIRKYLMYKIYF